MKVTTTSTILLRLLANKHVDSRPISSDHETGSISLKERSFTNCHSQNYNFMLNIQGHVAQRTSWTASMYRLWMYFTTLSPSEPFSPKNNKLV